MAIFFAAISFSRSCSSIERRRPFTCKDMDAEGVEVCVLLLSGGAKVVPQGTRADLENERS